MSERVAVIGSNSFSGSHFVDFALKQGAQVIGMSRSPEPNDVFLPYRSNSNLAAFKFHQADLNRDLEQTLLILDRFEPDYIVNFAAQSMVAESWTWPEDWFITNVVSNV